jgi:uncharacterized protein YecT (DUF1311 family)
LSVLFYSESGRCPPRLVLIAVLFSVIAASALDQSAESPCWKAATTQSEMNHCADLDARQAEADLNSVYQKPLSKVKADENATNKLRIAQRAWLAFRDAHLQELYPAEDKQKEYGSIYPMCYSQIATAMTRERTAQLRRMLDDKNLCDADGSSGPHGQVNVVGEKPQECLRTGVLSQIA